VDPHIDAEELAAWSSGTLPTARASRIEAHLADCDRCQSVLAVFVRTEPPATAPAPGRWRAWQIGWLVPLATAATVAAIWVALPERDEPVDPGLRREIAQGGPRTSTGAAPSAPPAATAPSAPADVPANAQTNPPSKPAAPPAADLFARAEKSVNNPAARRATGAPAVAQRQQGVRAETAAEAAPPTAAPPIPLPEPSAPPPAPTPAPTATPAPAPAATPPTAPRVLPASPPSPAATGAAAGAVADATARFRASLPLVVVEFASSDGASRWRIAGSVVERATPDGERWEAVRIESPNPLTAGAAVSSSVAWVVGRAGAVFVTADGKSFERVPFPETVDLVAVRATDARTAVVSTADGGTFVTADRGVSWRRQ
jgi:hypothetical protein